MDQPDWNDLKLFLALYRGGNMRQAATRLGVSHSTVARRFEQLETGLKAKLLKRQGDGYALTMAGESVFAAAEQVEQELDTLHRRLVGQEQQLAGKIRITMVDIVAMRLLMPSIAAFCGDYRAIDIELQTSYESLDLRKGDADIALRITSSPPEYLMGRRVAVMHHAGYATRTYLESHDLSNPESANWIGFGSDERFPQWVTSSGFPHLPARGQFESLVLQVEATLCDLGIGFLPCFVGDADERLVQVDTPENFPVYEMWLLRHPDTRQTARLRVFTDFIAAELQRLAPLLTGRGG